MASLPKNVPVIVGVGFHQERGEDPTGCSEPYQLMVQAARKAAADGGSDEILRRIESVSVPRGMWQYRNPGRLVAEALGCPRAKSILSDLGVLQLTLLSELCQSIAAGERSVGLVTGGEAQFRALRAMITQRRVSETEQPEGTPAPDVHLTSADPFCSDLESRRGLNLPVEFFAVIEAALRHRQGLSVDAHRDRLAAMYSSFSKVAAANPHAWRREMVSPEEIRNPTAKNPMLAFPYTKRHCSQWNVNRGVAILVCSLGVAQEFGLDSSRWIFPVVAVESKHVVVLAQKRTLHSQPGTVLCGQRAFALAGISPADLTAAELYSCFPAAIQSFALDLGLAGVCPLTVTGSMAFAGGPYNHFSLEGVARMVEVLRAATGPRRIGLVSNLSGIFGKQGCVVLSNVAREGGYAYEDVTRAVAKVDQPLPLNEAYTGPATIVGYTVVFQRDHPSHAIAICDTPAGERTVARSEDASLLEAMMREEFCGHPVQITAGGSFHLQPAV